MRGPSPILALLLGRLSPGVWSCPEAPDDVAELAAGLGWTAIELDLERSTRKEQILERLAEEANFPDYFGANWDATADCLKDLPGHRWLVIVRARDVETEIAPFTVLLDVLSEVSGFWARHGQDFSTLWIGPSPADAVELSEVT